MEAESADRTSLNGSWQELSSSSYSSSKALSLKISGRLDYGSSPSLTWKVKALHSGNYKVWARIRNTGGNSVYSNLDGDNGYQYFDSSSTWGWRVFYNRSVKLTAGGEHTFQIWGRDAGVEVDKVMLVPEGSSYTPSGVDG